MNNSINNYLIDINNYDISNLGNNNSRQIKNTGASCRNSGVLFKDTFHNLNENKPPGFRHETPGFFIWWSRIIVKKNLIEPPRKDLTQIRPDKIKAS